MIEGRFFPVPALLRHQGQGLRRACVPAVRFVKVDWRELRARPVRAAALPGHRVGWAAGSSGVPCEGYSHVLLCARGATATPSRCGR